MPTRSVHWPRILAEGFAIVVSILLAFGIQAWWEGRQDRLDLQLPSYAGAHLLWQQALLTCTRHSNWAALYPASMPGIMKLSLTPWG